MGAKMVVELELPTLVEQEEGVGVDPGRIRCRCAACAVDAARWSHALTLPSPRPVHAPAACGPPVARPTGAARSTGSGAVWTGSGADLRAAARRRSGPVTAVSVSMTWSGSDIRRRKIMWGADGAA